MLINLAVATRGSDFLLTKFSSAPSRGEVSGFLERLLAFLGPDLVRAPFPGLEVSHWGELLRALWFIVLLAIGLPVVLRTLRRLRLTRPCVRGGGADSAETATDATLRAWWCCGHCRDRD